MRDHNNYYHKYHWVEVELGGSDLESGRDEVTKDIFWGTKKTDNALIFVENYEKNKVRHQRMEKEDFEMSEYTEDTADSKNIVGIKNSIGDHLIMDLNPKNFEKPKDNLFFGFFSMYTKNVVKGKQNNSDLKDHRVQVQSHLQEEEEGEM